MTVPGGSDSKESACNAGDPVLSLGSERSLEKEMAIYSSILAWRNPWTVEPGGLQSVVSQRVGHSWVTKNTVTNDVKHIFMSSQGYGFSCGHVWMWELDCEERWVPKNWCTWTVVLEKTLESPLDCKEIQPVHSERDPPWVFFERNDAEAETPVLWPLHVKSWLIGKDWYWEGLGAGGEGDDRG